MPRRIADYLIQDQWVCSIILLNTLVLFLDAFPSIHAQTNGWLSLVDQLCTGYFACEILLKIMRNGWKHFWSSGWNRLDFWIVLLSLPSLMPLVVDARAFSALLLIRVARLIKFFRLLRFTPNGEHIWAGVLRSAKASISVFLAMFLLNLLFAMGATFLFGELAPEYFGNPLEAWYSLFKVFTVEGWYEVPDLLYERSGVTVWTLALRFYYVVAVFIGGLMGFALANAVFVDEMTADNTDYVETLVKEFSQTHHLQMQHLWEEIHLLRQLVEQLTQTDPKQSERDSEAKAPENS